MIFEAIDLAEDFREQRLDALSSHVNVAQVGERKTITGGRGRDQSEVKRAWCLAGFEALPEKAAFAVTRRNSDEDKSGLIARVGQLVAAGLVR
jgi:hypothetical protein